MRTKTILASAIVCTLIACGSDPSPIEACSGTYTCTGGKDPVQTELVKKGDSCTAGELMLNKDGTVYGLDGATWNGTSKEFKICLQGECLVCTSGTTPMPPSGSSSSSAPPPPPPHVGHCGGTATPCAAKSGAACYEVSGCYLSYAVNEKDEVCEGHPDSCYSLDAEYPCKQSGCTWQ